jgi:complex iron-sulfur molybdoenzyme family reductase subunit alpha
MPGTKGSKNRTLNISELDIDPILEGEWSIRLADGKEVMVTTVFEMLKESIEPYSPQETQTITGINPKLINKLAKDISLSKVVSLTVGNSLCKEFNGIMTIWNIASICGLTGHLASYGGLNTSPKHYMDEDIITVNGRYSSRFASGFIYDYMMGDDMGRFEKYFNNEDISISQNGIEKDEYISIIKDMLNHKESESIDTKPWWITDTLLIVNNPIFGDGTSREYRENFCKNIRYFAYADYKMSNTALYADLILPLKSKYECSQLEETTNHRYANLSQPTTNLESVGESKDEWEMIAMLTKRLEEIANKEENIGRSKIIDDKIYSKVGYHDLTRIHQEFTNSSKDTKEIRLDSDSSLLRYLLKYQKEYQPWSIKMMQKNGGFLLVDRKRADKSPIYTDRAYSSFEDVLYKLDRFETLTGRQTFYVDDDIYIKLGAYTNRGSDGIGDLYREKYPFSLITIESRWSSSSVPKTAETLLRLHRGVPYIKINTQMAKSLQIDDGDKIRVYNELGEFIVMAKLSHSTPPNSLLIDSGWEPYMFENNCGEGECIPNSLNLLEMVDGWGHLKFSSKWDGNRYINDGRVNIQRVEGAV